MKKFVLTDISLSDDENRLNLTFEKQCDFCMRFKKIKITELDGLCTAKSAIDEISNAYRSVIGEEASVDPANYICYNPDSHTLIADTSGGEYADCAVKINYCPFCGRKLE